MTTSFLKTLRSATDEALSRKDFWYSSGGSDFRPAEHIYGSGAAIDYAKTNLGRIKNCLLERAKMKSANEDIFLYNFGLEARESFAKTLQQELGVSTLVDGSLVRVSW